MTRLTKEMRNIVPILKRNGYVLVRSKGSHFIFKNRTTHRIMTINKNLKWMIWEEIMRDYNLEVQVKCLLLSIEFYSIKVM